MHDIMARVKSAILAHVVLVRTPGTARLEDLAHRTDAGRYLNGTVDVAHSEVTGGRGGMKGGREGDKGDLM